MKHFLLSLSLGLFLSLSFYTYLRYEEKAETQIILAHENKILSVSYQAVTHMFNVSIENYFKHSIMKDHVLDILHQTANANEEEKAALRGLLYRKLYPLYNGELKVLGIRQLHFHTPKGESFLRFHKPSENGDPLFDVRESIKTANVDKKNAIGFEGGKIYPGFRYVFPIIDKEIHLGSVELSLSFETIELELSKLLTCKNSVLLMKKEVTSDIVFKQHRQHFMPSFISSHFVVENEKLSSLTAKSIESPLVKRINTLLKASEGIEEKLLKGQNFSMPFLDGNDGYIANFHAISDITGRFIAYAVTYGYLDDFHIIHKKYLNAFIFGFLAIVLLSIGLFLVLEERKKALREKLRFETIVNKTINGVLLIDAKGDIFFINQAACRMLDYQPHEIVGLRSHTKIHVHAPHEGDSRCRILDTLTYQRGYIGEEVFRKKNGEQLIVHLNATPFLEDGKTTGIVVIFRDITAEKKDKETIEHLAYYDALTDLPNRKLLLDRLSLALAHAHRSREYGGFLFLDLDNFKTLNDTKGHNIGDLLLKEVAKRLTKELRQSDTVARFGGDEFVVLLNNLGTDKEQARIELHKIATKILSALCKEYRFGTFNHAFTHTCGASIGGILFCDNSINVHDILKKADTLMYEVKNNGKNGIKIA